MRTDRRASQQPGEAAGLYVLNLSTSATPQALLPATPQALREVGADLRRFTFFTTRTTEGGRERFRLHMGYFSSLDEAEYWLAAMRDVYPAAWAGPAAGQGDPAARRTSPPTLRASGQGVPVARPAPRRTTPPPVLGAVAERPLSESQVLRFLENEAQRSGARAVPTVGTGAAGGRSAAPRSAPEHFAVQLQRSPYPLAIEDCPPLPILSQFTLYTVEGVRGGERWYALRVGFFNDAAAAKQVGRAVRLEFAGVSIVPVSVQEVRSATGQDASVERVPPPAARRPAPQRAAVPRAAPVSAAFVEDDLDMDYAGDSGSYEELDAGEHTRRSSPFIRLLGRLGARLRR